MIEEFAPVTAFKAPLYVAWEITHLCNAKCLHCYSNSGPEADCAQELSTSEALSVIDQLADAGLLVLAFSGGEPMLRKDWKVLVGHAVARGLNVTMGTNGSVINDLTASELQQLGVRSVTISLDSHKSETHDYFRQCPGLYKRAVNAVRSLVKRHMRVVVGFTPTRINWLDGPELVKLAEELGAHAVNLSEYVPAGRGALNLALPPEDLRKTLLEWIEMRERFRGRIDIIWHDCRVGMLVPDNEKRHYVGCGAGRLVGRICPDGTMTPCVFLPTPIGSFRQSTFREMWNRSDLLFRFRKRLGQFTGNCGTCEYLSTCGGCRAVAYAYSSGNPLAGDPHCWVKLQPDPRLELLPCGEALPV
ncbi:radical SAM protein [Candidatus Methylomirabilis sp.]|uniref:radical SAM/SPASM domain-containing protein n=1 Tax=Candidatus Methylomirabilis sp. TaxID=2032687 RepID=UPI002A68E1A6|nr:radical SAM protein [Candidatus Methylomirabilis sp.]